MTDFSDNPFIELFKSQEQHQFLIGNATYKQRITKLKALRKAVEHTYKQEIRDALYKDFKKPSLEVDLTEIYPIVDEIKFVSKHLKSWLKKQKVETPMALLGSSSWIKNEPKGVCLIISPWNFPINLTFGPLVSAIAAGNTVIIKPSEMTPNASAIMAKIVNRVFDEHEVALVEGEVEVSTQLLKLPFNHIFFTGSPQVGKIVMEAASKNLSSVTLELGGKSPVIVDDSSNIDKAVQRICFGKFVNAGQTCIAPDYVFVNASVKDAFVTSFKKQIKEWYGEDISKSESFSRIVNQKHFKRLQSYIDDAQANQTEIFRGGASDEKDNFIAPTLVLNPGDDSKLMQNEIFGPILPVKTYVNIKEAVHYINQKEKPLALYIFSKNKQNTNYIINNTRAGGTCINHNLLQYLNHNLPFGGSNNSGIGKSHGYFGFLEFINQRAVLKQHTLGAVDLLLPPYTNFKQKLVDLTIKWF
ncbi:aldehyde dehydrogenase family protein [Subsaximicrobium wynnwilliamsii]|uniref:Aldehyde dehydrogenase n=1 Tax=Subsaximicrobium wynnwilliamsii TaxID=291179 RepID=A0A5C6ZFN4_9FLAO|nr:aldehyde dehydrogenase family protein [Subsaximicrobium wynnwilliamsii]TXD82413.1 aldehyde dehydrogenase family protein [Subsaximicrobium wynnwilliamsii]TXD88055.1 aldehyde dehydrogenase family protein [Subsaximicrobium wynnwilliamsii]TXE02083.1 aldehyde dehydrogenase family protein [Subsaximicrobium wynnwilliamsii]